MMSLRFASSHLSLAAFFPVEPHPLCRALALVPMSCQTSILLQFDLPEIASAKFWFPMWLKLSGGKRHGLCDLQLFRCAVAILTLFIRYECGGLAY